MLAVRAEVTPRSRAIDSGVYRIQLHKNPQTAKSVEDINLRGVVADRVKAMLV